MFRDSIPQSKIPQHSPRTALGGSPATHLRLDSSTQNKLLETLLDQTEDAVILAESHSCDLDSFRLVYANAAFAERWGNALRGITLASALTAFHEALTRPALKTHIRASLAAGLPVRGEPLTGTLDGQARHALISVAHFPRPGTPGLHWLVTLRDVTDSRRVEDDLRQTQDRYRMLSELMADVVSLHDASGRFLYVTPSVYRLTGYTVEETLGKSSFDFVLPEDKAALLSGESRKMVDTDTYRVEWRRLRKDGTHFWMETTVTRVRDAQGVLYRLVCSSRDIEDRKRAETVLREEQTLLRTLIESIPDQIFVKDRAGRYLADNEAHRRMCGKQPSELIGHTATELFLPALARLFDSEDRTVLGTGQPLMNQERMARDETGAERWVSTTKMPLTDAAGDVVGLVGISRDITERREAAEALRRSAETYRLLFQSNPQPIWVYDVRTLAILAVNDRAVASYGYSRDEFLQMTLPDVHPPEDLPLLMEGLTYLTEDTQNLGAWRHLRKDDTEMWAEVYSHRLEFNGRPARLMVANDITDRRRVETEAERLLAQTKNLLAQAVDRADRDPLTGLLNHRAFHKRLEAEARSATQTGQPLAVAVMDLDNFKFFNDGYGHAVGDDVLRSIAYTLESACRPGDVLARFGGDEFALLMPGLGAEEAVRRADSLLHALKGIGFRPPGADTLIPLTLAIGLAVFPDDGPGRLDALAAADLRLVRVKTGGTGRGELTERLRARLTCSPADFSMLNALVTAVDTKDRYTRRHSEDVMSFALGIAEALGLDEETRQTVLLAGLLHDVGKVGVPDAILRKPGALTAEEFEAVKQHPAMGAMIVGAVPGFEATLAAIRHHHERWDGGGYPAGLAGEAIPLLARLMAVADAFSAMTTDRPYRKGMADTQALAILEEGAGVQWDAECVRAFQQSRFSLEDWAEG